MKSVLPDFPFFGIPTEQAPHDHGDRNDNDRNERNERENERHDR